MSQRISKSAYCDGVTRRRAIQVGGSGLIGGLTLPQLLAMEDQYAFQMPPQIAGACLLQSSDWN